jgi:FkbM family methyltransferase
MSVLGNIRRRLLNRWRPHRTAEGRLVLLLGHVGARTVVDVGANRGQTGRSLRRGGWTGPILSIEPLGNAHARLTAVAAGDPTWVIAARTAVGDRDGEVEINVAGADDLSSARAASAALRRLMPAAGVVTRETVPLRRLGTVLAAHPDLADPWFVKIDTQGFEAEVLAGCADLLDRIVGFQLELSLLPLYEGEQTCEQVIAWMRDRGYDPWLVEPVSYLRAHRRQLQVDAVFVRRDLAAANP